MRINQVTKHFLDTVRFLYASINNILPKPISNQRNVKGPNKKKKNKDLYEKKNNKRQKKKLTIVGIHINSCHKS
jgi:hypothetical protein